MTPIRYAIAPLHPEAHLFAVTVTVDAPIPLASLHASGVDSRQLHDP
jgi:hypothetical protein